MSAVEWVRANSFAPYGGGRKAPIGSLALPDVIDEMLRYRRDVAKRYRIVHHEAIGKLLPQGTFHISTKLDGELWFLVKRGGEVVLASYNGRVLEGTPLVEEAAKAVEGAEGLLVAGELVAVPGEGRPRVQHVANALNDDALERQLRFFPFDVVREAETDWQARPYGSRYARLRELFGDGKAASRVAPATTVEGDAAAVTSYYRAWVESQQFEGIVVRAESGVTFKIKPTFTVDAVVVAYGDRRVSAGGGVVAEMRELTLALLRDDGNFQIIGPVGGGFENQERVAWRERLAKMEAESSFRLANREGTLCRFVRPEIVVEVKVSDLIETDSNDIPVARMVLRYEPEKGYAPLGDAHVPALLFPVFVRERADKRVDVGSVGLTQLTSRLPLDGAAGVPQHGSVTDAHVVKRGVWTKGDSAVRKYVVLETGKPRSEGYAPFVAYFTDYSAGRAEPLKTQMRVASTLENAERHVSAWTEENVKRGWVALGAPDATAAAPAPEPAKKKTRKPKAESSEDA